MLPDTGRTKLFRFCLSHPRGCITAEYALMKWLEIFILEVDRHILMLDVFFAVLYTRKYLFIKMTFP